MGQIASPRLPHAASSRWRHRETKIAFAARAKDGRAAAVGRAQRSPKRFNAGFQCEEANRFLAEGSFGRRALVAETAIRKPAIAAKAIDDRVRGRSHARAIRIDEGSGAGSPHRDNAHAEIRGGIVQWVREPIRRADRRELRPRRPQLEISWHRTVLVSPRILSGGGVYIMAIPRGATPASSITDSTISGNSAICDGDTGQYTVGGGGGLGTWATKRLTITNSTISGNTSSLPGGGLYTRHGGSLGLANSTITDNQAPARIADNGTESGYSDLEISSSIIAGNHLPGGAPLAEIVTVHSINGSNDLIASANVALPGDTLGGDPMLAPLADNGGPTMTHALLTGSPAINAGSNPDALTSDQRGDGYLRVYGAAADIGAFESQPAVDVIFGNGFD